MHSVRPSLLRRSAPLLVIVGICAFAFGGPYLYKAWNRRQHANAARRARVADERDLAIAVKIHDRFAALKGAVPSASLTCPADVTGPLELVEVEWFDWFVDKGTYDTAPKTPYTLRSEGFSYLTNAILPSDDAGFDKRKARLETLAAAKYVAIAMLVQKAATTKGSSFEGGTIDGTIAIGDTNGRFVCATHVASAPLFIIGLQQDNPRETAAMMSYETQRQVVMEFWTEAKKAVAAIAPGAVLVHE